MCSLSRRSTATGNTTIVARDAAPREPPVNKLGYGLTRTAYREIPARTKVTGAIWLGLLPDCGSACALGDILVA